jgi:hypothetical protein
MIILLQSKLIDDLNAQITAAINGATEDDKKYVPYGIPFSFDDEHVQLMYTDAEMSDWKGDLIEYVIRLKDNPPPADYMIGTAVSFNCLDYTVYVKWPPEHYQVYMPTIMCLHAFIPI